MFNNIINSNCTWFFGFRSCSFNPGLFNLSSVDTWWLLTSVLWCGDSPVHCSMFSSICDLYSLDISSTSIAVTPKMTPGIATCSLASRSPPVENHCPNPYSSHFPEVLIIIINYSEALAALTWKMKDLNSLLPSAGFWAFSKTQISWKLEIKKSHRNQGPLSISLGSPSKEVSARWKRVTDIDISISTNKR